ncbi:MAG: hypothetical protein LBV16_05180 [Elusimicrobiota bacterium]|nr:hypothetical protein [Elusimicrobiota bacterium]
MIKKLIFKTTVFIIIFLFLFIIASIPLKHKTGGYSLDNFYALEKNSRDVFFVGSSHVHYTIIPALIWQESGITSYDLTASGLQLWAAYYYIKEVLRYHKPKVIAVELYGAIYEISHYDTYLLSHISAMRFSKNKIEVIKDRVPKHLKIDYILGLPIISKRYKIELEYIRFALGLQTVETERLHFNGYRPIYVYRKQERSDILKSNVYGEIPEKTLLYLMKIIELSKENKDVKFLFFVSPMGVSQENINILNSIEKIAKENDIECINYNFLYDEIGIDFDSDFWNRGHTNTKGAMKVSMDLAKRLSKLYALKDNRKNPDYEFWNVRSKEAMQKIKDDGAVFIEGKNRKTKNL